MTPENTTPTEEPQRPTEGEQERTVNDDAASTAAGPQEPVQDVPEDSTDVDAVEDEPTVFPAEEELEPDPQETDEDRKAREAGLVRFQRTAPPRPDVAEAMEAEPEADFDMPVYLHPDDAALVQGDDVVGFRILGARRSRSSDAKYRTSTSLRRTPPFLQFYKIDPDGDLETIEVMLTYEMVAPLKDSLVELSKAYEGTLYTGSDEELKDSFGRFKEYLSTHKVQATMLALFVAFIVFSVVFF